MRKVLRERDGSLERNRFWERESWREDATGENETKGERSKVNEREDTFTRSRAGEKEGEREG